MKFFSFVDGQPTRSQPIRGHGTPGKMLGGVRVIHGFSERLGIAAAFQPMLAKCDQASKGTEGRGNVLQDPDEIRRIPSTGRDDGDAIGGAVDLQKTTENVILLGIRWLDAPDQGTAARAGHLRFNFGAVTAEDS